VTIDADPEGQSPTAGEPLPLEVFDHHGGSRPRGLQRIAGAGRYGRMFPDLPPFSASDEYLRQLADSMGPGGPPPPEPMVDEPRLEPGENPDLASGYTYVGQFADHDITFDPVTVVERQSDPLALRSFRTPRFDLDSLYGSGPEDSPYLYDQEDRAKLLVGHNTNEIFEPVDLPRNQQGRALIQDPRNDVHVIISQLHLAFIRFHNAVVDHLRTRFLPEEELFAEAQRLTRWHYQWVVLEDYLRPLVSSEVLGAVLVPDETAGGRRPELAFFHWDEEPFIPVEFSVAAFRLSHSQVRARYQVNPEVEPLHIFVPARDPNPFQHLGGFRPLPRNWTVQWDMFFSIDGSSPQLSRRIDTKMTGSLVSLPPTIDKERRSLALLDLLRARSLGLPSGQAVAAAMGKSAPDSELDLSGEAPLWYYLLREAEVRTEGRRLGPTGARIVAEVFVGLLWADESSFLRSSPAWAPELPAQTPGRFTIVDLLRFAGVA
jgi:hypothetical protein